MKIYGQKPQKQQMISTLLRETYFPPNPLDKISPLPSQSDFSLNLLDSIPLEQRKSPAQRAANEYLRGKMFDVLPEYNKEAEDYLSKAVKLNRLLADAWLCSGDCIWKKGDLRSAKNCFRLALSKIKEGDQLTLLEPYYHYVDFSWKEKHCHFKSIRVDFTEQVLANGNVLSAHHATRSSIYAQH